jgi:hypothetical protein
MLYARHFLQKVKLTRKLYFIIELSHYRIIELSHLHLNIQYSYRTAAPGLQFFIIGEPVGSWPRHITTAHA